MNMMWPIVLDVGADVFYQICCKSMPENVDTFASLTITYEVAAVVSLVMFLIMSKGGIMLIIVGYLLYKEPVKGTKVAGVAVCLAGLYLINK